MSILDRPRRAADERVVQVIGFRLGDERFPCIGLERRDATLLDCLGAITEPLQKRIDIELCHR
ncbi:MAG: hypothetical protein OEM67_12665 [Thermoleophilia bacterium]|nr:hypothetical protein [Thermoleophilia bacterium]